MSTETETETVDSPPPHLAQPGFGMAAALAALEQVPGEEAEEETEETEDAEEAEEEEEAPKPDPKGPRRSVGEAMRKKRHENKELRTRVKELEAKLSAAPPASSLDELKRQWAENPLAVLKQLGADDGALLDLLTKRSLARGKVPDEVLDAIEEAKRTAKESAEEAKRLREQLDQREQRAAHERALAALHAEMADRKAYPEFEGYTQEDLEIGAHQVVQQMQARGIERPQIRQVAERLHAALAKAHADMAKKKAPPPPAKKAPPTLPPVEPEGGKKRVREPTAKEVERRVYGALAGRRLISPC